MSWTLNVSVLKLLFQSKPDLSRFYFKLLRTLRDDFFTKKCGCSEAYTQSKRGQTILTLEVAVAVAKGVANDILYFNA